MSDVQDRAEQICLSAESLERQLTAQDADGDLLSLVGDVVDAARDLYTTITNHQEQT